MKFVSVQNAKFEKQNKKGINRETIHVTGVLRRKSETTEKETKITYVPRRKIVIKKINKQINSL